MWPGDKQEILDLIEKEKEHIWSRILELEEQLENATNTINSTQKTTENLSPRLDTLEQTLPDNVKSVIGNQMRVTRLKNLAEGRYEELEEILKVASNYNIQLKEMLTDISETYDETEEKRREIRETLSAVLQSKEKLDQIKADSTESINEMQTLAAEKKELKDQVDILVGQLEEFEDSAQTLKTLVSQASTERKEMRELHREVFGYIIKNDDDETEHIDGLKHQLEDSYEKIKESLNILGADLSTIDKKQKMHLENLSDEFNETSRHIIMIGKDELASIVNKIKALLPEGLTAGLAGAYEAKVKDEIEQLKEHKTTFMRAIQALVIVSSLPVGYVIINVLFQSKEFISVVAETPTIISLMLPMYVPILWVAHSSNKSYKLSKRLIEEYTHKEVAGKTFAGLSEQINQLNAGDSNEELRTKLLFNLLNVNSENPGKLISDYNNSDHPIIDAIDKSSKLADAVGKLDNVPLMGQLMKYVSARENYKLEEKSKEAEVILKTQIQDDTDTDTDTKER